MQPKSTISINIQCLAKTHDQMTDNWRRKKKKEKKKEIHGHFHNLALQNSPPLGSIHRNPMYSVLLLGFYCFCVCVLCLSIESIQLATFTIYVMKFTSAANLQ